MFERYVVTTAAMIVVGSASGAFAQSFTDFEAPGFVAGETVDNHKPDGTELDPEITFGNQCGQAWFVPSVDQDEEVVTLEDSTKAWRFSQGGAVKLLGNNPHSANTGQVHGETGAANDAGCGSPTTADYYAEVTFTSATGAAQPGLSMSVIANSADTRHAFTRIKDDGSGSLDLLFFDTVDGCIFNGTDIDVNLDPSQTHLLGIEIFFNDGLASGTAGTAGAFGNDVVNVYVNTTLVHTGTSWASCVGARSVDRILFSYATQQTSQLDTGGLIFDDVLVTEFCPAGNCNPPAPEFDSLGQCVSTLIGDNCSGLKGRDRAQCNHDQQLSCMDLFGVQ